MAGNQRYTDEELLQMLSLNSERAIEFIFKKHFGTLVTAVNRVLKDEGRSKDMVQDVFFKFWNQRDQLNIQTSLGAYLKRSCINMALDHLRKQKNFQTVESEPHLINRSSSGPSATQALEGAELDQQIQRAINTLQPKCRAVFLLSRKEGLSYREIGEKLNISVKTVEAHMSHALRQLRVKLKPFLPILCCFGYFF